MWSLDTSIWQHVDSPSRLTGGGSSVLQFFPPESRVLKSVFTGSIRTIGRNDCTSHYLRDKASQCGHGLMPSVLEEDTEPLTPTLIRCPKGVGLK